MTTLQLFVSSLLNGLSYGLLLFMLAAGLTLIFSLMGVMNFAHAGLYMLGAYFGYQIASYTSFWVALVVAPLLVGGLGVFIEQYYLRHLHSKGHVHELLFTFGLVLLIEEFVKLVWGVGAVNHRFPGSLDGTLFEVIGVRFPIYKGFVVCSAIGSLLLIWLFMNRTKIGLVVRAALTSPDMAASLGHNTRQIFALVFGIGSALAGLAGVVGGAALVTEPAMAAHVGTIIFVVIIVGGLGSLKGALIASMLIGFLETALVAANLRLSDLLSVFSGYSAIVDAVLQLKLSQIAPTMPYFLMVLMLLVRPRGLFGTRNV
jgi:branched-chain amino acid transport system permease protein